MPVKKILAEQLQNIAQTHLQNANQNIGSQRLIFGLIVSILILFVVNVGY
jgi:hypothetical protein